MMTKYFMLEYKGIRVHYTISSVAMSWYASVGHFDHFRIYYCPDLSRWLEIDVQCVIDAFLDAK